MAPSLSVPVLVRMLMLKTMFSRKDLRFITGIGLSAKAVESGGCDLILVYNSGRFRMAGRGSLAGLMPYSDANQVVVEMVCLHGYLRLRQADSTRPAKSFQLSRKPPSLQVSAVQILSAQCPFSSKS